MIGIIRKVLCIFMATFLCASIVLPKQILSIEGQDKTTLSLEFKYCQGEARAMLGLLNAFRTGKEAWVYNEQNEKVYIDGLQPFIYDYRLEELAMQRAAELVLNYDHVRPNGTYYYDLIMPEGYYDASGENISMGTASFMDYKMAFTFWQETNENYVGQGHRRNMLSPSYTSTGISCVEYNGMKFWVQLFANRIIQSAYKDPINSLKKVDIEVIDNEVLAFIKRLYRLCLNREADKAGISYWWLSLVNQSIMAADAVKGFFTSNEMNKLNLSDEEFVSRCYRVMMDREGDVAGKAYWQSRLEQGMSRLYVIKGFVDSHEFTNICNQYRLYKGKINLIEDRDQNVGVTAFVGRCYSEALGRSYDVGGLNHWCKQILSAANKREKALAVASNGFFHSQEFLNKNTQNQEFIQILYRTFLGRSADSNGLQHWLNQMAIGKSRDEIMHGFAYSKEFTAILEKYGL